MPRRRTLPNAVALVFVCLALAGGSQVGAWMSWSAAEGSAAVEPASPLDHLVVSEVITGAAGASDEFIEIYNPAPEALPLEGLELVYVSASGATITRKADWAAGAPELPPGAHLLVANEAGVFAAIADHLYANGLAAAGGSVALRIQGAATAIDAVGWGTAASTWLEGTPAPAPPAGTSLERLPGGALGSGQDTDHNDADFNERATPDPQNSGSPPIPIATPFPSPSVAPTPSPTPTPTPTPTGSPAPTILTIAEARSLPDGTLVTVEATALTDAAFSDGGGYLQDASGGIAVLVSGGGFPRGGRLRITGELDDRYHQRTIRADAADVEMLGTGTDPEPSSATTGTVGEQLEGTLVRIRAVVTSTATQLSNAVAFDADDGSGQTRLVFYTATGIDTNAIARGLEVDLVGVVGQRDSGGTGTAGYRVQPRDSADLVSVGPPATPEPSGSMSATPTGSASPSASPDPEGVISIAAAREEPVNARLRVRGVVTLPSQVLGDGTAAIQDDSGAIIVRLGDEAGELQLGEVVLVDGLRSTKSGMETVRISGPPTRLGSAGQPQPLQRSSGAVGERDEALLVVIRGAVATAPRRTSARNVYFDVDDGSGPARIFISPRTGIATDAIELGSWLEVVGVVGQETTGQQPLRGYRLWPRLASDLRITAPSGDSGPAADDGQGDVPANPGGRDPSDPSYGLPGAGLGGQPRIELPPPRLAATDGLGPPTPSPRAEVAGAQPAGEQGIGSAGRSSLGLALLLVTVLGAVGGVAARRPGMVDRLRASLDRMTAGTADADGANLRPVEEYSADPAPPRLVPLQVVDDRRPSVDPAALSTTRDHGGRILPPT